MSQAVIEGLMLAIIGILLILHPHGVWKATERWKLLGSAEESPAFVMITRIVGAVLAAIGLLVCFGVIK